MASNVPATGSAQSAVAGRLVYVLDLTSSRRCPGTTQGNVPAIEHLETANHGSPARHHPSSKAPWIAKAPKGQCTHISGFVLRGRVFGLLDFDRVARWERDLMEMVLISCFDRNRSLFHLGSRSSCQLAFRCMCWTCNTLERIPGEARRHESKR
ncbi:hypothetical protein LIA77_10557 [Sarocladium implicatum]|nr:hypothetical protein LIA77_10557 [Sarocladium implicatum]